MICDSNVPAENHYGYDIGAMLLTDLEKNGAEVYINRDLHNFKLVGDK